MANALLLGVCLCPADGCDSEEAFKHAEAVLQVVRRRVEEWGCKHYIAVSRFKADQGAYPGCAT